MREFGNVVSLEHVNLKQPDQRLATIFYVSGLGLTRDPYMMTGVENMWINAGRSQLHLPTGNPQRLRGTIELIVPDLSALYERLTRVSPLLSGTDFRFQENAGFADVTCPWGNRFRCRPPAAEFGGIELGIPGVEFDVPPRSASGIARFYKEILSAEAGTELRNGSQTASVRAGRDQYLRFCETNETLSPYDGHHIQIYIEDFGAPHDWLLERSLLTREMSRDEWRFRDIVDTATNAVLFTIEHEVRSVKHALFGRPLVNRNPAQNNRHYLPGNDAFSGKF